MTDCTIRIVLAGFGLLFNVILLQAQPDQVATLTGRVLDEAHRNPLDYATVSVMHANDSTLVTGTITDEKGRYSLELPYGLYYLIVEFIGYEPLQTPVISLDASRSRVELDDILLRTAAQNLDEVVVQAEKSTMEIALDKKVFNVGKDLGNAGGTAIDILGNIPSVLVDGEGNVKLRGSSNVRILVDGKPSGMVSFRGSAGLQQLQSNQIEKVEVITNPSARYEAEGMAGIINIVLKKERRQGLNGSFELLTGYRPNFGVGTIMNYRKDRFNFFLNYSLAYRVPYNAGNLYQEVYTGDSTLISFQDSESRTKTFANTVRVGTDYFFDEQNILTASYQYRRTDVNRIRDLVYRDYINSTGNPTAVTMRQQDEDEHEPYSELAITYKKSYPRKGQELLFDARYLTYDEKSDQIFTQISSLADGSPNPAGNLLQNSFNDEFEKQYIFQLDYVHPIGREGKFELGWRSGIRDMKNDYVVSEADATGVFMPLPGLDNIFIYEENIHGFYGIVGNKSKKISYQAGIRGEITDVTTILQETNEANPRKYTNFFPSVHFTYNLTPTHALQLSYSRRIRRPVYNDLSPYVTFSDQRNFFSGNPDLDPEFANAYDLGYIHYFEKGSVSSSLYYRHTIDKIFRIRRVDDAGFSTYRPENLATEDAYGLEFIAGLTPYKWWKADWNINFFKAVTDGSNLDEEFKADTWSWFTRLTSRFNIATGSDLQVRINYEAPQELPQGRSRSRTFADLSFSRDLWGEKGTLTLNAIDVFNSRFMRTVTEGSNFYTDAESGRGARQINLTLMFRLNQARATAKRLLDG